MVVGETGTAKTHCLRRAAAFLNASAISACERGFWKQPMSVSLVEWSELAAEDYSKMYFDEAVSCDVLLLDDIGSETDRFRSGEAANRLRMLLGRREGKSLFTATNIPSDKWVERWDARVEDRLLRSGSEVVDLLGVPSYNKRV